MSAWYDDTPEGPPPPLAPQMMEFQCDYGVLNHATAMQSPWLDGVNGDYSQMEFPVEDTDEAGAYWNPYLYQLQLEAPSPICVSPEKEVPDRPPFYGNEYHGCITHEECAAVLGSNDGHYLVRAGLRNPGTYSLSFVFDGRVRHFRLYYHEGFHYTGEKMFESVDDLVADGLIVLHMEKHNAMSFIDDARETVKTLAPTPPSAPTPPTSSILGSPVVLVKSDMSFRRLSLSNMSPVLGRRDRPGRLSLRPGRSTTSSHVLLAHEDQRFDAEDRPGASVDDSAIQPHKRSGSLRLFKAKSFEKRTLVSPSSSPSLVQSCTASDARVLQADPMLTDKRSPLIGRTSSMPRGSSLDERLARELSPPPLQPPNAPVTEPHVNGGSGRSELAYSPIATGSLSTATIKTGTHRGDYSYFKPHNFKVHSWVGPTWCELCRNFMWGLRSQGYQCTDCGFSVHRQCKDCTNLDCTPSQHKFKKLFGVDLTIIVKMYNTKTPVVLKHCISEVERRGLNVEGLYRMGGQTEEVMKIKADFDRGALPDLGVYQDIHAVSSALKLYLRELPVPLVAYDVYNLCLIAVRCGAESEKKEKLRLALRRLSKPHYNSLKYLIDHLHRIERFHHVNKMTAKNLAVVFAPTLIRSPNQTDQFTDMKRLPEHKDIVEMMIVNKRYLFP